MLMFLCRLSMEIVIKSDALFSPRAGLCSRFNHLHACVQLAISFIRPSLWLKPHVHIRVPSSLLLGRDASTLTPKDDANLRLTSASLVLWPIASTCNDLQCAKALVIICFGANQPNPCRTSVFVGGPCPLPKVTWDLCSCREYSTHDPNF